MSKQDEIERHIKFQENWAALSSESKIKKNVSSTKKKGEKKKQCPSKIKTFFIIISILILLLIAFGVIISIILRNKNEAPNPQPIDVIIISPPIENEEVPQYMKENGPMEVQTEYKIKTNKNDLKRIYINQKYYEDIKVDGVLTHKIVDRKTNYAIYVIDKINSLGEERYYYNFTYLCAIAIESECISSKDEYCVPKRLIDLNNHDKSSLRNIQQIDSLEKFPIALCYYNITDNNVVTSISCHKNISESKVNSIVLDLYFYRPPAIKRFDAKKSNITIKTEKKGDNDFISEINGGICDIYNPIGSFCTTEMNTTKDPEGNLLLYDEYTFTNITTDENNFYIKKKYTYLSDKTNLSEINPEKYNEALNKIYPHLKDYLKSYEQFSFENFKELYNVSKKSPEKKNEIRRRRLAEEKPLIENKQILFSISHYGGVNVQMSLKDNVGYNTQAMVASNLLQIDDEKNELLEIYEITDIDRTIKKLISLSKAGNNLATILLNKVKDNLNNITSIIKLKIPKMHHLLAYKELSDIFDSTFSLKNLNIIPYKIVEESDYLINKLEELYNGIDNGALKNNIKILNDYLYNFIRQSHRLVYNISNNIKELGNLIKSPKQKISDISSYYMKNATVSYIQTIKDARTILLYYYENETNLIVPKVKEILKNFENLTIESVEKQMNLINQLNAKLKKNELNIENSKDEDDYNKTIVNLHNSNYYINKIITLFKKKVENEMDLKNEYFISQNDIDSNNETFTKIIDEAMEIAQKLDGNEYVDKLFDDIMTNFRQTYINITKDMELKREEQFIPREKSLLESYFKISEQKNISEEIKKLGTDIIIKIKKENNLYLDNMNNVINDFLEKNKDYLNKLMSEINILLSTKSLEDIAKSYDDSINEYFNKLSNDIANNKQLTNEYIDYIASLMTDDNAIIKLLTTYNDSDKFKRYKKMCKTNDTVNEPNCYNNTYFKDSIKSRKIGKEYLDKYKLFKQKLESSKIFFKSYFYSNLLNDYKSIVSELKETLHSFLNNKISDKYPHYRQLDFIDYHIKDIKELYNRLNRYISDDIFNDYYYPKIQNFTKKEIHELESIILHIETENQKIDTSIIGERKDFCINFERKRTFTCRNGAVPKNTIKVDDCLDFPSSNNIGIITDLSFKENKTFKEEFYNFNSPIKTKINQYNDLISELKERMNSIEKEILSQNITNNYFEPIENKVNFILSEKYSENLIRGAYDYYYNLLSERLDTVLNDISLEWINSFDSLRNIVNDNINKFSHSINEFGVMALLFEKVISNNITKIFYDSIINHQKSEFNYTISYYYNCLLQNLTSIYQYVYNQIPTNQEGLNNIINVRKKEVNEIFNRLLKIVKDSKSDSLSNDKQLYVLQISSSNFFNKDSTLLKSIKETSSILKNKGNIIIKLKNGRQNDEFSLACRFYLENSINDLHIQEYFKPINEKDSMFIYLNTNKILELLSDNWIFDQDDFINQLSKSINESNLEIENDLLIKKKDYSKILENEIIKYEYSKENISQKINDKYRTQIEKIDEKIKSEIINYIQEILNIINNHIIKENERILNLAVSYSNNFSKINNTFQNYKEEIYNKLESIILNLIDDFNEKITDSAYTKLIEPGLNEYLNKSEEYISECTRIETLSSSYHIGEIINEIVKKYVEEYKDITKNQLNYSHTENIKKLKNKIEIDKIKQLIEDKVNPVYLTFLNNLKQKSGDIESRSIGYEDFDLNDNIKNDINTKIQENFEKIKNSLNVIKVDKNNKIELLGWHILNNSYDSVKINTFDIIKRKFEDFMNNKARAEKRTINELIKKIIRSNFNNMINNFTFTFGNEYFERMIRYNENFKIKSLFQNLKYSLIISLQYYQMQYQLKNEISSLTKDLKYKLYSLNNLDKIVEEKKEIILKMLNEKSDDFIEKTKNQILQDYKSYLANDNSIESAFSEPIRKIIQNNIKDISFDLEKDYENLLNEQFKNKFKNSYIKVIEDQAKDINSNVNELKQTVKSLFDDFFSLNIEKVLNNTNNQMYATIDSISEYNNYFHSFKLPEQLIEFTNNYGRNTIKPYFERIESLVNRQTKFLTLNNLEKKINEYEANFNKSILMSQLDNISSSIKEYINDTLKEINAYGNSNDYPKILDDEINRINRRNLRILNDGNEEDKNEEYKEKVADKSLDNCFHEILDLSRKKKKEVQTYEYFDNFLETIENFTQKLNLSYKDSQQSINDAFEEERETYQLLINRLESLNNLSLDYYNGIKDNFKLFQNYTQESLNEIDSLLNQCSIITYQTFSERYNNISKEANSIYKPYNEIIREIPVSTIYTKNQFGEFITEATIKALVKKAKFEFSVVLDGEEGQIKKPKVRAVVNNEIKPQEIKFKISSKFGDCGEEYQTFDFLEFNKVNYTIVLNFDTQSTLINVTTITDFDKINYEVRRYKIEDEESEFCTNDMLGFGGFCITQCNNYAPNPVDEPKYKNEPKKKLEITKPFVS